MLLYTLISLLSQMERQSELSLGFKTSVLGRSTLGLEVMEAEVMTAAKRRNRRRTEAFII